MGLSVSTLSLCAELQAQYPQAKLESDILSGSNVVAGADAAVSIIQFSIAPNGTKLSPSSVLPHSVEYFHNTVYALITP